MQGLWKRCQEASPLVLAAVAFVSAVVTLAAWVGGYFARESDMRYVLCVLAPRVELSGAQNLAGNAYMGYINTKLNILELSAAGPGLTDEQQLKLEKLKAKRERLWGQVVARNETAKSLAANLKDIRCDTPRRARGTP